MQLDLLELFTLTISIAIEAAIVSIWGKFRKLAWRRLAIVACASTLVTHPILWKIFSDLLPKMSFELAPSDRFNYLALLLEIPVVIVEGLIYKWVIKYSWRSSLSLSFFANLASYLFGVFLFNTFLN
ncbi:hypothetical protein [Chamaesiphon sp. VAR_48_metabat_403]|uniref:hypothetical protein n=1 Tax=Chamaesiphon sp. VAR_48_metabat_403 TaxID=2964700 RepID=UPI00286D84A9|nr:hypothetical protein [Chamaesiphon sp. VAR_48_metabat_403]